MQKQTLSSLLLATFVAAFFFVPSTQAKEPYQQLADYAIQYTKQSTNYGLYTPSNQTQTIQLTSTNITSAESEFRNQINSSWSLWYPNWWNNGFLANLATRNNLQTTTANNIQLDIQTRAKAMLHNDFYKNYLLLWNNPKFNTGNMGTAVTTTTTTTQTTTTASKNLTPHYSYQTTSKKTYFIRKSEDWYYWFSSQNIPTTINTNYKFRNTTELYNFLDFQNRIIYTAPNQRRYGIFWYNESYRFSRDEWSVSNNYRSTVNDVKAYIDQHNLPLSWCSVVKERKCVS